MSIVIHIGVRASNLKETIVFWRDGLGLKVVENTVVENTEICYDLTDGYHNFRVFQHRGGERPPHVSGMLDYLHIGIGVPDVVATAHHLLEMGYEIFSDGLGGKVPVDPNNLKERSFKVEDPDGITVDVGEFDDTWPGTNLYPQSGE